MLYGEEADALYVPEFSTTIEYSSPTFKLIQYTNIFSKSEAFTEEEKQCIADFKENAAKFIDACEELKKTGDGEKIRLAAIAQTKMEEAVMFAVKSVTK
jgi:hypothetical protein